MPVKNSPEREPRSNLATTQDVTADMQEFWTGQRAEQERHGSRQHPLFAKTTVLSEAPSELIYDSIASGCDYHTIWTQELLTKLHDTVDSKLFKAADPEEKKGLDAVKKALTSRGGAKGQARSLGMLIFRTATEIYTSNKHVDWTSSSMWQAGGVPDENTMNQANQNPTNEAAKRKPPQQPTAAAKKTCISHSSEPSLDEEWPTGKVFTLSPDLPEGAAVAVRDSPSGDGNEVGKAGAGSELTAVGRMGD
jgi:hypothetical protein